MANVAKPRGHVLGHPLAVGIGAGLFEIALEEFQDAGEAKGFFAESFFRGGFRVAGTRAAVGGRVTIEQKILGTGGEFFEGSIQIKAVGISRELERALEKRGAGAWAQTAIK